jgi:hypothetical protein
VTTAPETVTARASERPTRVGRPALAGEQFSVRATGAFTVGSWYDEQISPSGYPGGEAVSYNLASFRAAPHACAIALIGDKAAVEGVQIGTSADFVAGHAGALRFSLNDRDLSNNNGSIAYTVARGIPSIDRWLERGKAR